MDTEVRQTAGVRAPRKRLVPHGAPPNYNPCLARHSEVRYDEVVFEPPTRGLF